jgi:hypothetical protein
MIVIENADLIEGDSTSASETDFQIYGLDNNALANLADGQLANSKGTLYTSNSTDVVSTIILVNSGAAHNHVNLYHKPSGGTSRRLIPKDFQLESGYSLHWEGGKVMTVSTAGEVVYVDNITPFLDDTAGGTDALLTKAPTSNVVYDGLRVIMPNNGIFNGCFRVAQRGTTFTAATVPLNNDDTFLLDRFVLLSDGNDIVDVSQDTAVVPIGGYASWKFDVETANKKFGLLYIMEARDAARFIGGVASISFKARITGATINAIRAAVLSWSSTADVVTSDVVNAWGGAGTNPTVVANWTLENTPAALSAPTTAFQTYKIENIPIDTENAKNIAVFIWTDDVTMDVGDFLYISDLKIVPISFVTDFEFRPFGQELALCQRYCWQWNSLNDANGAIGVGAAYTANTAHVMVFLPVPLRAFPVTLVATGTFRYVYSGAVATPATLTLAETGDLKHMFINVAVNGAYQGQAGWLSADGSTANTLIITSEL